MAKKRANGEGNIRKRWEGRYTAGYHPETGELYHPDSVAKLHGKILKDAGLEHIRFHDLRHTFATIALQNGVDVKTVSSMLGHSDAGFTLRTYTHTTRQMQEQAAEKMGNFMTQISS